MWKEKKRMQQKNSHSRSSQQAEDKPFQKSAVEPAGEKDSESRQKHDKELSGKLRHAIEQKDKIIAHLQEQLKSSQISKDQENLSDEEEAEKESHAEGSRSTACPKKNIMEEVMAEASIQAVKNAPEGQVEQADHELDLVKETDSPTLSQTIDSSGGIISWEEEGIIVSVPPGAVPQGRLTSFSVGIDVSAQFSLPDDFELVSPIYHLSPDVCHFDKEVEICLFHGIDLRDQEDCESMTFLVASGKQSNCFFFQERKGGNFYLSGSTATLRVKHFCRFGIGHKKGQKGRLSFSSFQTHRKILGMYCIWLLSVLFLSSQIVRSAFSRSLGAEMECFPWHSFGWSIPKTEPGSLLLELHG